MLPPYGVWLTCEVLKSAATSRRLDNRLVEGIDIITLCQSVVEGGRYTAVRLAACPFQFQMTCFLHYMFSN